MNGCRKLTITSRTVFCKNRAGEGPAGATAGQEVVDGRISKRSSGESGMGAPICRGALHTNRVPLRILGDPACTHPGS